MHSDVKPAGWFASVVVPDRELWVITQDDLPVALLVLDDGWVDQLHVDPQWTGQGLGSVLVGLAKELRPEHLDLWTFQTNIAARRFYERHGFVAIDMTDGDNEEPRSGCSLPLVESITAIVARVEQDRQTKHVTTPTSARSPFLRGPIFLVNRDRIALLAAVATIVALGSVVAHALTIDQPNPIATPPPPVTVVLTGTVAVGNTVTVVSEEGAIEPVCASPVDATGSWSCSIPLDHDGTFSFIVTELDPQGVTVATDFRTVLVQPPPAPPTQPTTPTTTTPLRDVITVPARFTG